MVVASIRAIILEGERGSSEISVNRMRADLQKAGYIFVRQEPGETSAMIDEQSISVPFTNMYDMEAICRKRDGVWEYTGSRGPRGSKGLEDEIRIQYKLYQEERLGEKA